VLVIAASYTITRLHSQAVFADRVPMRIILQLLAYNQDGRQCCKN
jgi:hypothetical protein